MRRRLDVAASLIAAPPVLYLDEPTTGLDPRGRRPCGRCWAPWSRGATVLLTTQYMEEAERLAGDGRHPRLRTVIASGTPEQLRAGVGAPPGAVGPARAGTRQLAEALAGLGTGRDQRSTASGAVVLPVTDGARRPPGWLPGWPLACRSRGARPAPAHSGGRIPGPDRAADHVCARRQPAPSPQPIQPLPRGARDDAAAGTDVRLGRPGLGRWRHRHRHRPQPAPAGPGAPCSRSPPFSRSCSWCCSPTRSAARVRPASARYVDYLLPGIYVLAIGFGASQTGVAVGGDLGTGMIDRFRSLPGRRRWAVLAGGGAGKNALRNLFVVALMICGWRCGSGSGSAPASSPPSRAVGRAGGGGRGGRSPWLEPAARPGHHPRSRVRRAGPACSRSSSLFFTSSALVPVATMPGWLQAFARANTVTVITGALRALCLGGPTVPEGRRGSYLDRRAAGRHRPSRH